MARGRFGDLRDLEHLILSSPRAVSLGVRRAFDNIRDDWLDKSEAITPLETGHLRRETEGEVEGHDLDTLSVVLLNTAESADGFNYAHYIHEENFGGKTPRNGMEKKFLDKPLEENANEYKQTLEREVENQLRRAGW
ncbi:hypothetical protein [Metabacillus fastidiosus]|uniref:HK97 gp10 family phage protein n=1 Tax=Metabacillus fastidiosus TaxID=1458 RepID=A0ABU6NS74_9BACI|nr:hypothetical protein [Metabacillus fastidiosus]